jgi:tRNA threonylcarbamoyladenosine modification (KEOPS) complex Cgi121 subunit
MLKYLEEDGKCVEITGFRNAKIGNVKALLNAVRKQVPKGAEVQFFDADLVTSWQHLYFAVLNALMTFRNGRNISKSLAVEVLLYASAQRQIKKAIALIGVKRVSANVATVIISENGSSARMALSVVSKCIGAEPDEKVLELSEKKVQRIKLAFGISELELETSTVKDNSEQALVDLVIERVALLSTKL